MEKEKNVEDVDKVPNIEEENNNHQANTHIRGSTECAHIKLHIKYIQLYRSSSVFVTITLRKTKTLTNVTYIHQVLVHIIEIFFFFRSARERE